MEYIIKNTEINRIALSEDNSSLKVDITIWYNTNESKMQDSTTGCSIDLFMTTGERSTMKGELDTKIYQWFQENYNTI